MALKVYLKRGNTNYKEKKFISKIQEAVARELDKDPTYADRFQPANTFEELKALHDKLCIEDVDFEDVKGDKTETNKDAKMEDEGNEGEGQENSEAKSEEKIVKKKEKVAEGETSNHVDPFNREEPIVRDYVLDEGVKNTGEGGDQSQQGGGGGAGKSDFKEPVSFDDSFQLPNDGDGKGGAKKKGPKVEEPLNPKFNDMDGGKKKRSTKRFATYIVKAVCMLSEKGFVWYANQDINESKLAEYELSGAIDLSLLVTLENNQEATIKEFFQQQCERAKEMSKFDKEEQDDLIDALCEVLLEKGVAPTPMQELTLIGLKIFGEKAINLFALTSQTNSLLEQLKKMQSEETPYEDVTEKKAEPKKEEKKDPPEEEEGAVETPKGPDNTTPPVSTEVAVTKEHEIGESTETKE